MEEKSICEKCGQIHTGCNGHPKLKNSKDGQYHPCSSPAMANGVCSVHGGKTPSGAFSPHYKHGRRSKYLNDFRGKRKKVFEKQMNSPHKLPSVLDNIDLEEYRLHELLQMLDESSLLENWENIQKCFKELYDLIFTPPAIKTDESLRDPEDIIKEMTRDRMNEMKRLFTNVSSNERIFDKIDEKNERIRKFQETNAKLRTSNYKEMIAKQKLVPVEIFKDFSDSVAKVFHQVPDDLRRRLLSDLSEIFFKLPRYIQEPLKLEE